MSALRAACLAATVTLLMTACGGDDAAPTAETTSTAAAALDDPGTGPTETTRTGPEPTGTGAAPAGAPPDAVLTQEELGALLPTAADVPAGWTLDQPPTPYVPEPDQSTIDPAACAPLWTMTETTPGPIAAGAETTFLGSADLGETMGVLLARHESTAGAATFDSWPQLMAQCGTFTMDDGTGPFTISLYPIEYATVGDASAGYSMAIEQDGVAGFVHVFMAVTGDYSVSAYASGAAPVDQEIVKGLLRTTVDRVQAR